MGENRRGISIRGSTIQKDFSPTLALRSRIARLEEREDEGQKWPSKGGEGKSAMHLIPMVNWICKARHREQKSSAQ